MRIVIVGNGPAALSAVEAIRETDGSCDITILASEAVPAYTPCFLAKYVAGRIGTAELALKCDDFNETHRVEVLTGQAVTAVSPDRNVVRLADGSEVGYDMLLLACGADPIVPDTPGMLGDGVFFFRTLGDAARIRERVERSRDVVVLGSGFVAMEIAEALAETGAPVSVVARRDRILRRIFDAEVAGMVEAHMSANGVTFVKGRDLVEVERDGATGEVRSVALSDGERLPCDMLVVGVGMLPNVGLVEGTSIAAAHGILTDAAMRTSVTNVYAAGDVAEAEVDGVRKANLIHPNAVAAGRVAGRNMVGGDQRVGAHLADMNVLTVFDRSFLAVGALEGDTILKRTVGADGLVKVFADEDRRIKGVELVGDVTRGGLYASLIAQGASVDALPELLSTGFNYGQTMTLPTRVL